MSILKSPQPWLPVGMRRYTDPLTGEVVVGETSACIIEQVVTIRKLQNLLSEDVESEVEEWLCVHLPSWCMREALPNLNPKVFGKKDVLAFLSAVSGTITSGGVVTQEEADRRANICRQCPLNQTIAGCEGCSGISTAIFKVLGAKTVRNPGVLKSCGVCGCAIKAKIWVPGDVIQKTAQIQENLGEFPDWCWVPKA